MADYLLADVIKSWQTIIDKWHQHSLCKICQYFLVMTYIMLHILLLSQPHWFPDWFSSKSCAVVENHLSTRTDL